MKKNAFILSVLIILGVSSLYAGNIDFQLGGGYSGYFTGEGSLDPDFSTGFALFGGIGYRFAPLVSAGVEYEFAKSWSHEDGLGGLEVSLNENIPRLFVKTNALNLLSLTALAGMDYQDLIVEGESVDKKGFYTAGLRVSALFAYAQYMIVFIDETDHRISLGAVFNP